MAKDYKQTLVSKGKFLSLLLRHKPEKANLEMDDNGWVEVEQVISNTGISEQELHDIISTNNKKRYVLNEDETKIRAAQGHSLDVDIEMKVIDPPTVLYHGTATRNKDIIEETGLKKMNRQHVHLSVDVETAKQVGGRHGTPIIFEVNSWHMRADGIKFYLSDNDVWLTDYVDPKYLKLEEDGN